MVTEVGKSHRELTFLPPGYQIKVLIFPSENELTAETAREIENLELEEEKQIMSNRPPVRQAWR